MNVTVLAIFDGMPADAPLAKVMKERLLRHAAQLRDVHLHSLTLVEPITEDVVIYISYNPKYTIRWRIVNDVPGFIEEEVAAQCALLGYIQWKTHTINVFKSK